MDFVEFAKIPRLSRECIITEKIDGTNGVVYIGEDGTFLVGSRNRWITPEQDNYGFARWAYDHKDELMKLGPGWHHGEWWGQGIQRKYGLDHRRWSLFNASKWSDGSVRPACCHVVPIVCVSVFTTQLVDSALAYLRDYGSLASPGFMQPEGVVIWHEAARMFFKKTLEKDEQPKSMA